MKCGCMQGCCVDARPGVRSWRHMVQVAVSTRTNRVGAAARVNRRLLKNYKDSRGKQLNVLLAPRGGWVSDKPAAPGGFLK